MTIGSLFSGIGGLELGLEACGLGPVIWQAEIDPHARAVLEQHWPEVRRYNDVREIDANAPPPEIICGGFPCQDISNAGKRAGIGGEKSGLWSEYARIIRALRPRVVFVENVAALAVRGLDRVLGDLASLGFDAEWDVLRASDVGAPHLRARLFILAYAHGFDGWIQSRGRGWERGADSSGAADDGEQRDVRDALGAGRARAEAGEERAGLATAEPAGDAGVADAHGPRRRPKARDAEPGDGCSPEREGEAEPRRRGDVVADAMRSGQRSGERDLRARESHSDRSRARDVADAAINGGGRLSARRPNGLDAADVDGGSERLPRGRRAHRFPPGPTGIAGWDGPQPAIRRSDDGVPGRSHRLRLLGNAVVQQQAALAFRTLTALVLARGERAA